ncbi:protein phosphatase 2A regulatory subunit cdc55 [Bonamia ostreae]|uniref:Serine/threonine-protein phosphatase 2A 55 kDa regulatory subunit B n=1 Tax=Bonamia ostreae TaxID=126728 RepID=A0ABV2AJT8_9EUKA
MSDESETISLKQIFRHSEAKDIFTSVDIEEDGEFIATGDSSGKVWIYNWEADDSLKTDQSEDTSSSISIDNEESNEKTTKLIKRSKLRKNMTMDKNILEARQKMAEKIKLKQSPEINNNGDGTFDFYGQFQSHEPSFDYLKSLEIDEGICMVKWLPRQSYSLFLISTNDKMIKLWKIYERSLIKPEDYGFRNVETDYGKFIRLPNFKMSANVTAVSMRNQFKDAHAYHINSISINDDKETFLSADDLRINIWNLENSAETYNVVDIKPEKMESLKEVITTATFHPMQRPIFLYGTNEGSLKFNDLRMSSNFDVSLKESEKMFNDVTSAIADIKFLPCENEIITRNYLSLTNWDVRQERYPLRQISVMDKVQSNLITLYESDLIFDKFECAINSEGSRCVTGTYGSQFVSWDLEKNRDTIYKFSNISCDVKEEKTFPTDNLSVRPLNIAYRPNSDQFVTTQNQTLSIFETGKNDDF